MQITEIHGPASDFGIFLAERSPPEGRHRFPGRTEKGLFSALQFGFECSAVKISEGVVSSVAPVGREVSMTKGVISDFVPGENSLPDEAGFAFDELTGEKERHFHLVFTHHSQKVSDAV